MHNNASINVLRLSEEDTCLNKFTHSSVKLKQRKTGIACTYLLWSPTRNVVVELYTKLEFGVVQFLVSLSTRIYSPEQSLDSSRPNTRHQLPASRIKQQPHVARPIGFQDCVTCPVSSWHL